VIDTENRKCASADLGNAAVFKAGLLKLENFNCELPIEYIFKVYIFDWKSNEMHMDFLCILYFTILALHVSGAIRTHHQEHKLQSTAVGACDCYGVLEVG
jgi:hypothetical protein